MACLMYFKYSFSLPSNLGARRFSKRQAKEESTKEEEEQDKRTKQK